MPLGSSEVERGRWSLFLCGIAPKAKRRAAQPFGMCTGEVTIQCPQVKCLSLIPAGWQEQGCSSHPGCSSAEGAGLGHPEPHSRALASPWGHQGPQCHHSSYLNSPVPAAHLGFQIKPRATLLFLRKEAGLCRMGWPNCSSPNTRGNPRSCWALAAPAGWLCHGLGALLWSPRVFYCPASARSMWG